MKANFPPLIERRLLVKEAGDAKSREVVIQIGQPHWTKENAEAACPVAIHGLLGRVQDIRGIDFLDAMSLAIEFVNSTMSKMRDTREFYWPDGEPYFEEGS